MNYWIYESSFSYAFLFVRYSFLKGHLRLNRTSVPEIANLHHRPSVFIFILLIPPFLPSHPPRHSLTPSSSPHSSPTPLSLLPSFPPPIPPSPSLVLQVVSHHIPNHGFVRPLLFLNGSWLTSRTNEPSKTHTHHAYFIHLLLICSLEFDLHSQILSSLASTLAKDSATTNDEVQRLIRAGPLLPAPSQPSTPKPHSNGAEEGHLPEGGLMVHE